MLCYSNLVLPLSGLCRAGPGFVSLAGPNTAGPKHRWPQTPLPGGARVAYFPPIRDKSRANARDRMICSRRMSSGSIELFRS